MRWAGSCSTYREKRNAYRILVGKPEGSDCLESVVASTSHKLIGLHGLLQGHLYFTLVLYDV
jgi:hypothetical protein